MPRKEPTSDFAKLTQLEDDTLATLIGGHPIEEQGHPKRNRHVRRVLESLELLLEFKDSNTCLDQLVTVMLNAQVDGEDRCTAIERWIAAELTSRGH